MNTCPDCPNDLVCHDQGECLRPTPETDALQYRVGDSNHFAVHAFHARLLERERNEAREQLASEKSTRNAIIAKGLETERQLFEAREENAKLRKAIWKVLNIIPTPTCDQMHHAKKEQHEYGSICPPVERVKAIIDNCKKLLE